MDCYSAVFKNPFYIEYRISPSPPTFIDRETEVDWRDYLQFSKGSKNLEKKRTKRVQCSELLELAAVIKQYRRFWILWTTWTLVLPNLLICLSMDESSHEQFPWAWIHGIDAGFSPSTRTYTHHTNLHSCAQR